MTGKLFTKSKEEGGDPHPLGGDRDVSALPNRDHFFTSDFLLCKFAKQFEMTTEHKFSGASERLPLELAMLDLKYVQSGF